jgi:hypothetical protein
MMGTADHIALSQAFGASAYVGMNLHPEVLQLAAQQFVGANMEDANDVVLSQTRVATLKQLIEALELNYGGSISVDEYLDLFDRAETRRVRLIVGDMLARHGGVGQQEELRNAVRKLNDEVRRLTKSDLLRAEVDVIGDLGSAAKPAVGAMAYVGMLAAMLQLGLVKKLGQQAFDKLIEDTKAGDALDKVRGRITGTSSAAVRLFRIRSRLPKK